MGTRSCVLCVLIFCRTMFVLFNGVFTKLSLIGQLRELEHFGMQTYERKRIQKLGYKSDNVVFIEARPQLY